MASISQTKPKQYMGVYTRFIVLYLYVTHVH